MGWGVIRGLGGLLRGEGGRMIRGEINRVERGLIGGRFEGGLCLVGAVFWVGEKDCLDGGGLVLGWGGGGGVLGGKGL